MSGGWGAMQHRVQEAAGKALVTEAQQLLASFWQPERVRRLALAILQQFLPLTVRPPPSSWPGQLLCELPLDSLSV